jgi:sn-glycerol 3-phosphate transport system ATP-binding protein
MNFIPATCQKDFIILCNGTKVSKFKSDHKQITVGIRPEHLQIDNKGNIQVMVQMVEQLGANTLIHGLLEETDVEFVVSIPGHVNAVVGSVMAFSIKNGSTHIFHTDTGKRIA